MSNQRTISKPIHLRGIGLHSGAEVSLAIQPAAVDSGIVFKRSDVTDKNPLVPARYDMVTDTRLGTTIKNADGVSISTIEHLMAAIWGSGIDNALVTIEGPEIPIMDGSSWPFIQAIANAGTEIQGAQRQYIRVKKPIVVRDGQTAASVEPLLGEDGSCLLDVTIDFADKVIARHRAVYDFNRVTFEEALAEARTFGFAHEVEYLRSVGLARGGSLDNAIVVGKDGILNEEGLRFNDEFVRHKALDCIGDLFLAGYRLEGRFTFVRPGHSINNKLLHALFADAQAYELITEEEFAAKVA
jgi:UDP-3-O-[3-hydroxymyristoyl] N-acetylglucosamine deacetylase